MLEIWLPKRLTEEAMQKSNHQDAKLHLSECKVTPIMVYTKKLSPQNCINIQFECIFMQFWVLFTTPYLLKYRLKFKHFSHFKNLE